MAALESGKHCPDCGRRTFPLAHKSLARLFRRVVVRRWCPACGWEGLRKRPSRSPDSRSAERTFNPGRAAPRRDDRPLLWGDRDASGDD